ncbi:GntR family transcriptional regulator [Bosea sp. NPDC055594]
MFARHALLSASDRLESWRGSKSFVDMDQQQHSGARHAALAAELTEEIGRGDYPLGSRFPSEHELQERFGVGRHTIREALKVLTEQGLLGRRRKTGTVVLSHRPVSHYVHSMRDIRSLFDFAQNTTLDIQHEGFVSVSGQTVEEFAQLPDKRWFRVAGLRSTRHDGTALCWSEVAVPERFAPNRDDVHRGDRAVYEIVLQQFGLRLDHVEQSITATTLSPKLAAILNAQPHSAALMVKRHYVAHPNTIFEISHNLYPADRYSMHSIIRQRA